MSLYAKLELRAAQRNPLRVGLIGAGKFGAMYLAQVPKTPGIHLLAIADLTQDPPTWRTTASRSSANTSTR